MTSNTLKVFLDEHRHDGADWNLIGMGSKWKGKYKLSVSEHKFFMALFHEHVFVQKQACSILERQQELVPLLLDLDFQYASGGPLKRRFTDEQVRACVAAVADCYSRFFSPTPVSLEEETVDSLCFFVTLKPSPEKHPTKDCHKDGIHILCPSVTLTHQTLCAIRGYLLQTGVIERIFGTTGYINSPHDIIDLAVVRPISPNCWFPYGGCKPDKPPYTLSNIFTAQLLDDDDERGITIGPDQLTEQSTESWSNMELIVTLSLINGHAEATPLVLREVNQAEWDGLLSRWGSGNDWSKMGGDVVPAKRPATKKPAKSALDDLDEPKEEGGEGGGEGGGFTDDFVQLSGLSVRAAYSESDIVFAYTIAEECLNPELRAKSYHDWIALGLLLHNIAPNKKSCEVWASISRKVKGYEDTPDHAFTSKWDMLPAEGSSQLKGRKQLMMGTLHMWAKIDDPILYDTLTKRSNTEMALLNSAGTHDTIANLAFRMYREEFRCTPPKKGARIADFEWFQFERHAWKPLMTATALRSRLGHDVRNVYLMAERALISREIDARDEDRDRIQAQKKNINKINVLLQNAGFKNSVMSEITEKFYDEDFIRNLNQDVTLVGFENGVLELKRIGTDGRPHIYFRPGRPDDCISFQMGRGIMGLDAIPYVPYDPDHPGPEHLQILDFFEKIYPDPVLRKFVWILFSACLEGGNLEQMFYILSGVGGNGKSKIIELLSKTFGEYQDSLTATALTRKRADAGSANPEYIELKNKRVVTMVEPENGEKINTSLMKQITGGDMMKVRGLFKGQEGFVFTARPFMSVNTLPPVDTMDEGTWRRFCVIPHVARFVKDGIPTDPANHVHPRDPLLDSKIVRWRPYFAGILAWYFENHYLREGLVAPAIVTAASDKYKEENDIAARFARECIVRELGAELKGGDIYKRYLEWAKINGLVPLKGGGGVPTIKRDVILARMGDIFGKPTAALLFAGVRFVDDEEDASGGFGGSGGGGGFAGTPYVQHGVVMP